jgi:hypothetical protein
MQEILPDRSDSVEDEFYEHFVILARSSATMATATAIADQKRNVFQ